MLIVIPITSYKTSVKVTSNFFVIFFFMPQKDKGENVSVTSPFTGFPYVYLKNNKWVGFFLHFQFDIIKLTQLKILLSIAYTGNTT